ETQVAQSAVARRTLGMATKLLDLRRRPQDKAAAFLQIAKGKAGCTTDALVEQHCRAAADLGEELGTAVVGRDQGRLGRGQRNVIISLREQSVDAQGTGDADRHLDRADEVLNVVLVLLHLCARPLVEQVVAHGWLVREELPTAFDYLGRQA